MITTEFLRPQQNIDSNTSSLIAALVQSKQSPVSRSLWLDAIMSTDELVLATALRNEASSPYLPDGKTSTKSSSPSKDDYLALASHIQTLYAARGLVWGPLLDICYQQGHLPDAARPDMADPRLADFIIRTPHAELRRMLLIFRYSPVRNLIARTVENPTPLFFDALLRKSSTIRPFLENPTLDPVVAEQFALAVLDFIEAANGPQAIGESVRKYSYIGSGILSNDTAWKYISRLAETMHAQGREWPSVRNRLVPLVMNEAPSNNQTYYGRTPASLAMHYLAFDPSTPPEAFRHILKFETTPATRCALLQNPSFPLDCREAVYKVEEHGTTIARSLPKHPIPLDIQKEIVSHISPSNLVILLSEPTCPVTYAEFVAQEEDCPAPVREAMAKNTNFHSSSIVIERLLNARNGSIIAPLLPSLTADQAVYAWSKWFRAEPDDALEYLETTGLPHGAKPPRRAVVGILAKGAKEDTPEQKRTRIMRITKLLGTHFLQDPPRTRGRPKGPAH